MINISSKHLWPVRITLNQLLKFWCNQTRHGKFPFFALKLWKKGPKQVPEPLMYSQIKYIDLPDPFECKKYDINTFFHLVP